jgi:hypothetical protein
MLFATAIDNRLVHSRARSTTLDSRSRCARWNGITVGMDKQRQSAEGMRKVVLLILNPANNLPSGSEDKSFPALSSQVYHEDLVAASLNVLDGSIPLAI